MKKTETNIVLFSVMLCWASAYVFMKSLPDELSNFGYLALMNGLAGIIMAACFHKKLRFINKSNLKHSFILAVIMMLVLIFEKEGVDRLSPSSASILSSLDIVFVPLFMIFIFRYPSRQQIVGAAVILIGILITNGITMSGFPLTGSLFMLGDCICMSGYTIVSNRFCREDDPIILAVFQIIIMAIISMIAWTIESPGMIFRLTYTRSFLSSVFVLAIFTKAFAYIMLMYGEKYSNPVDVVLIFALEPVVTFVLSLIVPESFGGVAVKFSMYAFVGALVIVIGTIIANLDLDSAKDRKNAEKEEVK
ncbi:MAG: DMT family transporter [Lachnospiraceae bacterium]|nr:DMT family transporter [Lachnospiraceae bacterium]